MRTLLRCLGGLALIAACAATAGAQSIGLKGGWAHPALGGSDATGWKAINTFSGGGFLTATIKPYFAIEADALYTRKGAQEDEDTNPVTMKLGYIEFPVLARGTLPIENSPLRPMLLAGPYLAFRATCKGVSSTGLSATCDQIGNNAKSADFGLTFGGGVGFPLGEKLSGEIEARYDLGLTRIDSGANPDDVKNRSFMVFVGFSIPIGYRGPVETSQVK